MAEVAGFRYEVEGVEEAEASVKNVIVRIYLECSSSKLPFVVLLRTALQRSNTSLLTYKHQTKSAAHSHSPATSSYTLPTA